MKFGFIGFGKMGSAIAFGALKAKVVSSEDLIVFDRNPQHRRETLAHKILCATTAQEVVDRASYIFLCVKPQQMNEVLGQMIPSAKKCFISVAAGIPIKTFEHRWRGRASVIRVMPNTPSLLGAGMSVISAGRHVQPRQLSQIRKIFLALGQVLVLPEKKMNVVTALSGSGPAYVFYLTEALIEAGLTYGLSRQEAETLARQTAFGAGLMLARTPVSPSQLRQNVTSKGGTTEAALRQFERHKFKSIVAQALGAAVKRSQELSQLF